MEWEVAFLINKFHRMVPDPGAAYQGEEGGTARCRVDVGRCRLVAEEEMPYVEGETWKVSQ